MRMPGERLRRCQLQLLDRLTHIPRDELDGGLHCGHHPLGLRDPLPARLAEAFLVSNGGKRADVLLDISGNACAVATHAALHVHNMGGVANGADALRDLRTLPGETLVLVVRCRHILGSLLQVRSRLWRAAWTTLCRRAR